MENKDKFIAKVFNAIADDYDRMNLVLTGGFFPLWQKSLIDRMALDGDEKIIDVCCGSGKLTYEIYRKLDRQKGGEITGIDFSENMLKKARERAKKHEAEISFLFQDALDLDFPAQEFDRAINSFALRNVNDIEKCLAEIYRVLKNGGTAYVMEVSRPDNKIIRFMFEFYYYRIVPLIGMISDKGRKIEGGYSPYKWLSESLKKFPEKKEIEHIFYSAGFRSVELISLGFGGIAIFIGKK